MSRVRRKQALVKNQLLVLALRWKTDCVEHHFEFDEECFNLCGRKFSLKAVLMIAEQMLTRSVLLPVYYNHGVLPTARAYCVKSLQVCCVLQTEKHLERANASGLHSEPKTTPSFQGARLFDLPSAFHHVAQDIANVGPGVTSQWRMKSSTVYLIDFGLAKKYRNPKAPPASCL
eukprot:2212754-Amphidinium_carterae.1